MLRFAVLDGNFTIREKPQYHERAGFDAIGDECKRSGAKLLHPRDGNGRGTSSFDTRSVTVEVLG